MCHTPQARHSKVARSGKPSNRGVRLASRIGCAQLGQRGGTSVELGAFVSHMIVIPGLKGRSAMACGTETSNGPTFGRYTWERRINGTWLRHEALAISG
jgi:hypothetical protein